MTIRNILHRGVRRLFLHDDAKAVPPAAVDKVRKMLAFLQDIATPAELHAVPIWRGRIDVDGRLAPAAAPAGAPVPPEAHPWDRRAQLQGESPPGEEPH